MRLPPRAAILAFLPLLGAVLSASCARRSMPRAPDLPLVILDLSGTLLGRLDPCGCAANQKGGLATRKTFLWRRRATGAVALEGCRFLPESRWGLPYAELNGRILMRCLGKGGGGMDYAGMGVGAEDLLPGLENLKALAAKAQGPPLISSNILDGAGRPAFSPFRVVTKGEARVFVTSLTLRIPPGFPSKIGLLPWKTALATVLEQAPAEAYRVLLLDGGTAAARAAARAFPGELDLVLTAKGDYNPTPGSAEVREGDTVILDPGSGGRFVLEVELTRKAGKTRLLRYTPYPLPPKEARKDRESPPGAITPDPAMMELITAMRCDLADGLALSEALARPAPARRGGYTGSRSCFPCHEASARAWKKSPHARAWAALEQDEEARGWPITLSPECVSCHVVGFGMATGFESPEKTPDLLNVGCEVCHGPGREHVKRMMRDPRDPEKAVDRAGDGGAHCFACHDTERQTHGHFHYSVKWKKIRHEEPAKWADRVKPKPRGR